MPALLQEDFAGFAVGPLPKDGTAAGEYHCETPSRPLGAWYDPMRGDAAWETWLIFEDDGRHRLLVTAEASARGPHFLVSGEPGWADYTVTFRVQQLRPEHACGCCFRYQTSRHHYRLVLERGEALRLLRVDNGVVTPLDEARLREPETAVHEFQVSVAGDLIRVLAGGRELIRTRDGGFAKGKVALFAAGPAIFDEVRVESEPDAHAAWVVTRDRAARELDELRARQPQPVLWKRFETPGFGTGRQVRFGHLVHRDQLDILLIQNLKLRPGSDSLTTVRCLTAVDLDGRVLWQFGEPSADPDAGLVTCDVPVQIYDIDGDGQEEVLCLKNFKLYVLDGRNGSVKHQMELPWRPADENLFGRVVGDALSIANLRGLPRPSDILIKNRYRQIWAYSDRFELLWTRSYPGWWTGHFPQPYDFNGDGRDEILIGYSLLDSQGERLWHKDWNDHADEIAIGPFMPERPDVQIALVCGEGGFNILAPDGAVLHREFPGHAQRLSAAKFRPDLPGLQFYVVTYWGSAGIISLHDCHGDAQFRFEATLQGNVLTPVNWTCDGVELVLLNGDPAAGGMLDGWGRRVVTFPADGHPQLAADALDLNGDGRDEILLWDRHSVWIYAANRPVPAGRVYAPRRWPHYNNSNYRGEISLPAWKE